MSGAISDAQRRFYALAKELVGDAAGVPGIYSDNAVVCRLASVGGSMGFVISGTRAGLGRRFAATSTIAQQPSRLCLVVLVQIGAADYVANVRRRTGGVTGLRFLPVDGGRPRRGRTLYLFIAGFAAQSVAYSCGLSGCRDGFGRARAFVGVPNCLPLDRWRCPFW